MIPCQCQCGHQVYTPISITVVCPKCKASIKCDGEDRKSLITYRHLPANSKPGAWVRLVRFLRSPSDTGVGDTVQRIAAKFGGERFKKWAKKIGIPCGCDKRQAEWNRLYPY